MLNFKLNPDLDDVISLEIINSQITHESQDVIFLDLTTRYGNIRFRIGTDDRVDCMTAANEIINQSKQNGIVSFYHERHYIYISNAANEIIYQLTGNLEEAPDFLAQKMPH